MKKSILSLGIFVALALTVGFNDPSEGNEDGPKIEFEKTVHNYGEIPHNGDGNCIFVFENTGTKPLILNNVRSSCGCTTPKWPRDKPINPGETDTINVRYNTRIVGNFTKSITVYSNAVNKSPVRLTIKGQVVKDTKE